MDTLSEVVRVEIPTFHPKQVECFNATNGLELVALRAGRRWGKNVYGESMAADLAMKGEPIGWFAPEYKRLSETYENIVQWVEPVKKRSSKQEGVIRTITGGRIDFWSLEDENAGRGRKYRKVILDEGAFGKPKVLTDTWLRAIKPTLIDYAGSALVMSNTNGINEENFFWQICNQPEFGFKVFHAPTHSNPFLPLWERHRETWAQWLERRRVYFKRLRESTPPLVYQQENLAEFVDWSGAAFFALDKLLVNHQAVPLPAICDGVFAVIDTAVKDGKENDGTAVTYFATSRFVGHRLVILDWDIIQIEGALLETWLPTVFQNLERLARECRARMGSAGALIEDKNSGTILLQQAARRGWPATPIESKLTELGKDARAISVSGYVYQEKVKISQPAYDKVVNYKGVTRNHLISQVVGFRIGDKEASKRADDLTDTFTYGIAVALGNEEGF